MVTLSLLAAVAQISLPTAAGLTLEARGRCGAPSMDFGAFVQRYGRPFRVGTEEYDRRRAIFEQRAEQISRHNCAPVGPWTAAINHLTDRTPLELAALHGHRSMHRRGQGVGISGQMPFLLAERVKGVEAPLPKNFSWEHLENIKADSIDQGDCGSCWAHASMVVMRSRAEIKGMRNMGWSTDQLVACTPNPKHCGGEGGCQGATAELAFEYVLNMGLLQDSEFPARGGLRSSCPEPLKSATEVATRGIIGADGSEVHRVGAAKLAGSALGLTGWTKLPENKEDTLVRELMANGPVYVAVAAGDYWFDYSDGVMTEEACGTGLVLNHAVVLIAWGVKENTVRGTVKYWRIKNSWGPTWGERGTGRLVRSDQEEKACGWDEDPKQGSGCDGGPERVYVCGSCGILYDAVAPHF